ncbi:MAG: 50S ribosomal protein L22 [Thermoleophilaceae bacterium]|nr:50S ribosomal protein L22 [Thermoleophilaceae bacterium]
MTAARRQAPEGGWDSLKIDELRDELEARGLSRSGKKEELVARLIEDDASEATPAAAPEAAPEAVAEEAIAPEQPAAEPSADEVAEEEPAEEAESAAEEEDAAEEQQAEEEDAAAEAEPAAPSRPAEAATARPAPAASQRDGALVIRARARYVRSAPRKARLVMDHIRGKNVEQAQAILRHAPRAVSADILKLLNSAVANAESTYELAPDELRIGRAFVDEGPTIKRFRPRARGRATRILKRTSHMTIELTTEGNGR